MRDRALAAARGIALESHFVRNPTREPVLFVPAAVGLSDSIFQKRVVRIAVQPALSGLRGCYDRMRGGVRVFASVPIRRTVAAERHATCLAGSQVHPV